MGADLRTIDLSISLFNTPYKTKPEDLDKIEWDEFNDKSREVIQSLGIESERYSLDGLILDANQDLLFSKLFLAIFPYFDDLEFVQKLPQARFDLDKFGCLLLRLMHRMNWKTVNSLQVAYNLKLGLVTTIQLIQFLRRGLDKKSKLPEADSEAWYTVEKYARQISVAEQESKINSYNDPGEVAEFLGLESLNSTMMTIEFFNNEVLGQESNISTVKTAKSGLTIQDQTIFITENFLDGEIDKLMAKFEEMEKRNSEKKE